MSTSTPLSSEPAVSRRSLLGNMGALLSGTVLARALSALAVILLARQVGPGLFGQYAASMSLARISAVLFAWGLDTWLLREAGRVETDRIPRLSGAALTIKAGGGLIWLVAQTALAPLINGASFPAGVVALCASIVYLEELASVAWSTLQARFRSRIASLLMVLFQALVFAATLALILGGEELLSRYLLLRAVMAVVGSALSLLWLVRVSGLALQRSDLAPTVRASAPFALSMGLAVIYGSVDVTLVASILGVTAAGLYSPASTLVTTLYLIPAAMYNVMIPALSRAHAHDLPRLLRQTRTLVGASAMLGLALGGALALGAPLIVRLLFGPAYAESATLLRLLSVVLALHSVSFAAAAFLTAVGRQDTRILVQALSAAINIVLNLLLMRRWGLVGVSWAFILSEIVLVAGYLYGWQREAARLRTGDLQGVTL